MPNVQNLVRFRRLIKRLILAALGQDIFPRIDCRCRMTRLGSEYGGWEVALDYLDTNSTVYSFGIGQDVSFDLALIERIGLTIHAFDPTPASLQWIANRNLPSKLVVHPYGLADFDGEILFHPPLKAGHVSYSIAQTLVNIQGGQMLPVRKLSTIMREFKHKHIDLLKMDIEAAEYQVLDDIVCSLVRPQQILVEFHHRFSGIGVRRTIKSIQSLRAAGYGLCAISFSGEEYSFILKSA